MGGFPYSAKQKLSIQASRFDPRGRSKISLLVQTPETSSSGPTRATQPTGATYRPTSRDHTVTGALAEKGLHVLMADTWQHQLEQTHPDLLLQFLMVDLRFRRRTGKKRIKTTHCKRFLRNSRTILGPVHPVVAAALTRLALLQYWRKNLSRAQDLLDQAVEVWKRCPYQDEPELHLIQGIRSAIDCRQFDQLH